MKVYKLLTSLAIVALLLVIAYTIWHFSKVLRAKVGAAVDDVHWLRGKLETLVPRVEGELDSVDKILPGVESDVDSTSKMFGDIEACLESSGNLIRCLTANQKVAPAPAPAPTLSKSDEYFTCMTGLFATDSACAKSSGYASTPADQKKAYDACKAANGADWACKAKTGYGAPAKKSFTVYPY